jgi:hypothetical protein
VEFGKRWSTIDAIIDIIVSSIQTTKDDAAACLIVALFNKFEDVPS